VKSGAKGKVRAELQDAAMDRRPRKGPNGRLIEWPGILMTAQRGVKRNAEKKNLVVWQAGKPRS
jgi:hypothetical protein